MTARTQAPEAATAAGRVGHAPPGAARRQRAARLSVRLIYGLPAAVLLVVLSLYPLVVLVQMSVDQVTIANLRGYWPFVGFANFRSELADPTFRAVAVQTLVIVVAVLVLSLTIGFLVALVLHDNSRLNRVTQTTMVLVWTLPPIVTGSLWKFLLASDGGLNTLLVKMHVLAHPVPFLSESATSLAAVTAITLWSSAPFAVMVIKSAVLDVPRDVIDAASVDGAGTGQIVTRVILPMIRPTLLTLGVLSVVGAFKAFDFIYVMTRGGPGTSSSTIPFLGYLLAFQNYQFGLAGAVSVIAMLIVLALAIGYIYAIRRAER
jgi:multiple sugar transport system permease protein